MNQKLNTALTASHIIYPKELWDLFLQDEISKHFFYIDSDVKKYLLKESSVPRHASPYFPVISPTTSVPIFAKQYTQLGDYAGGITGIIKFVINKKHSIKNGWYLSPSTQHNKIPTLQKDSKGFWLYLGTHHQLANHIGDIIMLFEEYHVMT